jgi:hypothetical protein
MKLRIQDNSLRLRLTQKEVARLGELGLVESSIRFSEHHVLRYSVLISEAAQFVSVSYNGGAICVFLPEIIANRWVKNADVSIEGLDSGVQILVEKDFQCLHQSGDRDPDGYPHPLG